MEEFYCVFTFHVTQHALIFEDFLKNQGIDVKLMPVPRQISSSCGTAAHIPCQSETDIKRLCQDNKLPYDEFHRILKEEGKSWFAKFINKGEKR